MNKNFNLWTVIVILLAIIICATTIENANNIHNSISINITKIIWGIIVELCSIISLIISCITLTKVNDIENNNLKRKMNNYYYEQYKGFLDSFTKNKTFPKDICKDLLNTITSHCMTSSFSKSILLKKEIKIITKKNKSNRISDLEIKHSLVKLMKISKYISQ